MSLNHETQYFLSQDGLRIYYKHWDCENAVKICCIVHGHGEHSSRYAHIAKALNDAGITVFAMDLRGHGISQGKKGHAKSYELVMSDIEELLKTARAEYTDLPMYLMGHSLGGNLVANYAIRMNTNELSGYILSSPWFQLAFEPPAWKLQLGKWFSKLWPSLTQPSGLNVNHISRDQQEVDKYVSDPLIHDQLSAGFFEAIRSAGNYALDRASQIKLSGLIYHGTGDRIIDWKATELFASKTQASDFHKLEGTYHEPHNDLEKQDTIELLKQWILSH